MKDALRERERWSSRAGFEVPVAWLMRRFSLSPAVLESVDRLTAELLLPLASIALLASSAFA